MTRSTQIQIRISEEEKAWLEEQAGERKISKFVRDKVFGGMAHTPVEPIPPEAFEEPSIRKAKVDLAKIADEGEQLAELQRRIKVKQAHGLTRRLAEQEAREELAL